jgi:methionine-gamma-lyase
MSGSISTVAIHADRDVHPSRAVAPPIYQTATFWAEDAEQFAQAAVDRRGQGFYTRYGNPNHAQVAAVVAELEHTEAAMVTASGMAALTTAVLALVSTGDHVIGQRSTYGGTASVLLNLLPRLGVSTTQVDQADPEAFENALTPQTRLILVESPSNPLLQITDLRAVADLARAHNVLTIADNTFATPVNQRPADFGIDLVWHSATKYLNGHSDVSAGSAGRPGGDPGPNLGCRPAHWCRTRPVRRVVAAARPAHPAAAHATAQRQRPGARGGAQRPSSRSPGALSRPGDPPAARAGAQPDERFRRGTRH